MSEARISHLTQIIARCDALYYNEGSSPVPDSEYDRLVEELLSLGGDRPSRVGAHDPDADVRHARPMLSLDKAAGTSELDAWKAKADAAAGAGAKLSCEYKIDGLSLTLTYVAGRLVQAATRGDGNVGRDVFAVASQLDSIPSVLVGDFPPELTVRGEAYMSHSAFDALREAKQASGEKIPSNPRNAAAGSLMRKNVDIAASRGLELFVYDMVPVPDWPDSASECLSRLESFGLPVSPDVIVVDDVDGVQEYFDRVHEARPSLGFDIDGIVVKTDSTSLRDSMGVGSRTPYWAVACKFPAQEEVTRLLDIKVEVGRTGRLTPVAILEPVEVDGSMVERATLHNAVQLASKDVRIGDDVVVRKAGDIIPEVVAPLLENRTKGSSEWEFPADCPSCGGPVRVDPDAPDRYCDNPVCRSKVIASVEYFASRAAMDIKGLGPEQITALVDSELVSHPIDLYGLSAQDVHTVLVLRPKLARLQSATHLADVAGLQQVWDSVQEMGHPGVIRAMGVLADAVRDQLGGAPVRGADGALRKSAFSSLASPNRLHPSRIKEQEALSQPAVDAAQSAACLLEVALDNGDYEPGSVSHASAKLHAAIVASKTKPAARVLTGMGIRLCGRRVSGRILDAFGTFEVLAGADVEAIAAVEGVGPAAAANVREWLSSDQGAEVLFEISEHSVGTSHKVVTPGSTPEPRTRIVVTGKMSGTRTEMTARFEALGAKIAGSLSKNVDYLVTGEKPGASKVSKAESLGVKVVTEAEFTEIAGAR